MNNPELPQQQDTSSHSHTMPTNIEQQQQQQLNMGMGGMGPMPMFQPSSSAPTPNNQIDPTATATSTQTDILAAELRRMQQVRQEENTALFQLLGRQQQQMAAASGAVGPSGPSAAFNVNAINQFSGMNMNMNPSSVNGSAFGAGQQQQQQMNNNFMLPQSLMNNLGMNMNMNNMGVPGMDGLNANANSLTNRFRMNQPAMSSVNGNGNNTLNNMNDAPQNPSAPSPNAAAGTNNNHRGSSSSPQFEKVDLSSTSQQAQVTNNNFDMSSSSQAFMNSQNNSTNNGNGNNNGMNIDSLSMMNDFLQKNPKLGPMMMAQKNPLPMMDNNINNNSNNANNNNNNGMLPMNASVGGAHSIPPGMPMHHLQAQPQEDPGWEDQFKSLRSYHLQFGHCKVPARFKLNPKLGRWVMTQRRQFTLLMQGMPSALTAERIRRLEALGFTWSVRPEPVTTWNKKFQELKAYKATYGNCMVPQRYRANPQLGTWVHTQRRQYKLMMSSESKKSSMTKEKSDALDSIGFDWDAKHISASSSGLKIATIPGMGIERSISDASGSCSEQSPVHC